VVLFPLVAQLEIEFETPSENSRSHGSTVAVIQVSHQLPVEIEIEAVHPSSSWATRRARSKGFHGTNYLFFVRFRGAELSAERNHRKLDQTHGWELRPSQPLSSPRRIATLSKENEVY
jgi:hypothetical protein